MISSARPFIDSEHADLAPEMRAALGQLARAIDYSRELECDCWDFAVEIDRLFSIGLTTSDLRWLVKRGYVMHAREATSPQDVNRRFEAPEKNLAFCKTTCFVITEAGLWRLRDEQAAPRAFTQSPASAIGPSAVEMPELRNASECPPEFVEEATPAGGSFGKPREAALVPNWDREARVLQVGDRVVKRFRVPSPNQESVLDAFQEEGWPSSIDDPLSPVPDQVPKRRLRDTIKCLNLNQAVGGIRFRGDGTGQRVLWELFQEPASQPGDRLSSALRAA